MSEVLSGLRAICQSFPEVSERPSHGAPTWFVRGKKAFATAWLDGHHDQTFPHLWCAAAPGVQDALVSSRPDTFFRPPYVGHRGWLGVRLDRELDLDGLAELLTDAYCEVAPKGLATQLGE
ncbi:MAG: MmcQ/YjbR family DNA-binding protein [Propionicimonas sp.]|nr:MmcQ/YjbR family DNA-binding protein [Propionicimonas sp.]